ncbi:MAG: ABC transporter permease [Gemmatimonadetes bacterium]|uniref:ABC transporter permease n=1 Tax=Candidatus Kutchimonas denitrificans TaxID=3056748 RepID=A0AAE4ZDE5_9BACT|nr:ABC transporter permease [Gemmatimonadota bacterium]NIR76315.1 ABC transporter permease [Candidatus Kutchimonas denitrificans]NIS02338.1 ABC transporter permease [Gemmatimonadota bacterium]NIT68157.1 ABC transporter permease [Gemmatimonadota bacterium]NIU54381.1 FtsX-like permease family protein [Gemmatimonadota bacterium]
MTGAWTHLRYAVRRLVRNPTFSVVAIVMVAAGIGANTAVFSVVEAVLLRSLPYQEPGRLVAGLGTREGSPTPSGVLSAPDLADYLEGTPGIVAMGGVATTRRILTDAGDPLAAVAGRVTPGYFETVGLRAVAGRLPSRADFRPESPPVIVLAHSTWVTRFGARPDVVGTTVRLHDRPATVIGVLEYDPLHFPERGIDVWIPLRSDMSRGSRNLTAVARLADDVTIDEAQQQLDVVAARLRAEYPDSNAERGVLLRRFDEAVTGPFRAPLFLALACTGLVLLIMCANLGNMLLARTAARAREFGIRAALGAGRRHLARDLLLESAVLVLAGGAAGILLAAWLADAFVAFVPTPLPRGELVSIDRMVVGFALAVCAVTTLVATLIPALGLREARLHILLKAGGKSSAGSPGRSAAGSALVVAQVAFSCVLVVGAGLLLQSFVRLSRVDTGIATENRLAFRLQLPSRRYPEDADRLRLYDRLTRRLADLPGVLRAGAVSTLPLSGGNLCDDVTIGGEALGVCAEARAVGAGYFETLRIPLLEGRGFGPADDADAPRVALVNDALARRAWPDRSAIGRRIETFGIEFEVVGVLAGVRHFGPSQPTPLEIYTPVAQATFPWMTFVIETRGDPRALLANVQRVVWELDPELPLETVATLDELLSGTKSGERFRAALVGGLSGLALALAAFGLYGLLAFLVEGRAREFGIRMALGADGGRLVADVLGRAIKLAGIGLALGLALSIAAARGLETFLFATSTYDPAAYLASLGILMMIAVAAASLPARRAARVDPVEALRQE